MKVATLSRPLPAWRETTAAFVSIGLGAGMIAALVANASAAPELVAGASFACVLSVIAGLDVLTLRAPNRVVYPAAVLGLGAAAVLGSGALGSAFAGGVASFSALLLVALIGRGAMGYGDVKVGALCGIATGIGGVVPMLAATFVTGGAFAAVVLSLRLRGRKDPVAFTPFLVLGVAWSLAAGHGYLVS